MGFGKVYGPYGPYMGRADKPVYQYTVFGFEKSQALAAMLWPWLGTRRKDQAEGALQRATQA